VLITIFETFKFNPANGAFEQMVFVHGVASPPFQIKRRNKKAFIIKKKSKIGFIG